ncbi:unnamed protein product [Cuscuta epithymum]|uniref:RING-type domain-containing protein n=1 Tax=Cuscuta epithymum TaxID=186058 RepID=A0AAV0D8W7_9ASTE|nr:unnamed protein product [Cuscuta epithymum]
MEFSVEGLELSTLEHKNEPWSSTEGEEDNNEEDFFAVAIYKKIRVFGVDHKFMHQTREQLQAVFPLRHSWLQTDDDGGGGSVGHQKLENCLKKSGLPERIAAQIVSFYHQQRSNMSPGRGRSSARGDANNMSSGRGRSSARDSVTVPLIVTKTLVKMYMWSLPRDIAVDGLLRLTSVLYNLKVARAFDGAEECSVCLETMGRGEKVFRAANCSHHFHALCLLRWLDTDAKTCPLCRCPFAESPYIRVLT